MFHIDLLFVILNKLDISGLVVANKLFDEINSEIKSGFNFRFLFQVTSGLTALSRSVCVWSRDVLLPVLDSVRLLPVPADVGCDCVELLPVLAEFD